MAERRNGAIPAVKSRDGATAVISSLHPGSGSARNLGNIKTVTDSTQNQTVKEKKFFRSKRNIHESLFGHPIPENYTLDLTNVEERFVNRINLQHAFHEPLISISDIGFYNRTMWMSAFQKTFPGIAFTSMKGSAVRGEKGSIRHCRYRALLQRSTLEFRCVLLEAGNSAELPPGIYILEYNFSAPLDASLRATATVANEKVHHPADDGADDHITLLSLRGTPMDTSPVSPAVTVGDDGSSVQLALEARDAEELWDPLMVLAQVASGRQRSMSTSKRPRSNDDLTREVEEEVQEAEGRRRGEEEGTVGKSSGQNHCEEEDLDGRTTQATNSRSTSMDSNPPPVFDAGLVWNGLI